MKSTFPTLVLLAIIGYAQAVTYSRTASLSGQSFLDFFSWDTIPDPTRGRVEYVSRSTAEAHGLYSISGNTVTLRADDHTVLSGSGSGRESFRLRSDEQYYEHVSIWDIGHMPVGCATWPAVWCEVNPDWPDRGEIDIVEGTNGKGPNQSTLHTSQNCTMPSSRTMTGTSVGNNCNVYATNNAGCGVHTSGSDNFGPSFNFNGGGWYVIERSAHYIKIFFWDRHSPSVPSEVRNPGNTVHPDDWGTPAAYFPDTDCNFPSHFGGLNFMIDLTFCGQWASATYKPDGCPKNCIDYVNYHPEAFSQAYFEFDSLNIYQ